MSGCVAQQTTQLTTTAILADAAVSPAPAVTPSRQVVKKSAERSESEAATSRWVIRSGRIKKTFSQTAQRAGIPNLQIRKLEALFGEQIDFRRDIQKGDHFTAVFQPGKSGSLRGGKLLAAELNSRREPIRVIRHTNRRGISRFYSGSGEPLGTDFLRNPLKNVKVSSHFTLRRFHPVLKVYRPHRGTDFAARKGTPVMATADGVVQKREYQNGYGKVVFLEHSGGRYTTVYAHLSRFARGIKPGRAVHQGQIIGYVGSTGLATGSHLHYEFREDGEYKDAMKVALPRIKKPTTAERKYFYQATADLRRILLSEQRERRIAMASGGSQSRR